jgi:hydrogenase/urease accessory protein HupE
MTSKQRGKGKFIWAILFGVFGLLIAMFATTDNYTVWIIGAIIGVALGFMIGKNLEKEASH